VAQWLTAKIRPKSQNSNTRHDGILSIGNFMLMINNHFARFQLTGNLFKTKKMCSLFSWQHAISYLFDFNFNHYCVSTTYQKFSSLAVQEDEIYGHLNVECPLLKKLFFSQKWSFLIKCPGQNSHQSINKVIFSHQVLLDASNKHKYSTFGLQLLKKSPKY
jgi:hypothetical protein